MKIAYSITILALLFGASANASTVLFDNASDVNLFNVSLDSSGGPGTDTPASYVSTGGLSGSGAVQMNPAYKSQSWISKEGFTLSSTTTYTVSAYMKIKSFTAIGFTASDGTASPPLLYPTNSIMIGINSDVTPYIQFTSTGTGSAADEDYTNSPGDLQNTVGSPASYANDDWVFFSLSITADSGNYTVAYSANLSDASGTLGGDIIAGTRTTPNTGLFSGDKLYPFFYFDGGGFSNPTVDTFSASVVGAVPEPATVGILTGITVLFAVCLRRRARS